MIGLKRSVSFLGKSTFFTHPIASFFVNAFGALPVFRRQDEGLPGGPNGDAQERNQQTFDKCAALLQAGGALALFPEGTTHTGSEMLPLRTGAARIAFLSESSADWQAGVTIVPVGLWYERQIQFRSSVLVVVGEPFSVADYAQAHTDDEHEAVRQLTEKIDRGLDAVVLQAENSELLRALPVLAVWTAPKGVSLSMDEWYERTALLLSAHKSLHQHNPARLQSLEQQARRYVRLLNRFGIKNPWALKMETPKIWQLVRLTLGLLVLSPFALLGLAMSYLPYKLTRPLTHAIVGKDYTQTSTVKILGGTALVILSWFLEAVFIGLIINPLWGATIFLLAAPLAYLALVWAERFREWWEMLRANLFRLSQRQIVEGLEARRRDLALEISKAMRDLVHELAD